MSTQETLLPQPGKVNPYPSESTEVRAARLANEKIVQDALDAAGATPKKEVKAGMLGRITVKNLLVTGGALGAAYLATTLCSNITRIITPEQVIPTPTPIVEPYATPTSEPIATSTATETALPTFEPTPVVTQEPVYFEETKLEAGKTLWTNSYDGAENYLKTFHADRFYSEDVLTEEGKRVSIVMADSATVMALVDNNITLDEATRLPIDYSYRSVSNEGMTPLYMGIIGHENTETQFDANLWQEFTDKAQTTNFYAAALPEDLVALTGKVLEDLQNTIDVP